MAIVTFFTTKHSLKEYIRDKTDVLNDKIHKQEIEIQQLKIKIETQIQVTTTFQNLILEHLPKLYSIIDNNKNTQ